MTGKQLKSSILQWAIQGKLVPQDPNDEPASVLLEKIRAEKARLIKEGKIKKDKKESIIYRGEDNSYYEKILASGEIKCIDDELPYSLPCGWEWCRMGNIGEWGAGATPAKGNIEYYNGNILWLRTGELNNDVVYNTEIKVTEKALKECSLRLNKVGDVMIAMYGATIGKVAIVGKEMTTNQACCACTPIGIFNWYLFYFLMGSQLDFIKKGEGGAQPNISREKLITHLMPVPPIEEQHRIVSQIREVLPYVERYAHSQIELNLLNEGIKPKLRKSILQEAIQGKLAAQDPNDEPASILLQRIKEEKQRLVKEGKLKKKDVIDSTIFRSGDNKYYEQIGFEIVEVSDEIPFEIPDGWVWVRLQQIVFNREQETPTERFSYIDIGSIDNQHQCLNAKETLIDPENAPSRARKLVEIGDILYSTVRPYLHNMCIIDRGFSYKPIASTGFAVMACCSGVYNKYLFYYLLSPAFDNYANDTAKGAAYPAINDNQLYRALIPLPPLAEQQRIVDRVNELLAVCDELK